MPETLWKPIRPHDWVNLERIVNEIWLILNVNITLSEISQDALDAAVDIAALQAAVAAIDAAVTALEAAVAGLDSIAGSDTQVQFNDGGIHGADSDLTFDKTTKTLTTQKIKATRVLAGGVSN